MRIGVLPARLVSVLKEVGSQCWGDGAHTSAPAKDSPSDR